MEQVKEFLERVAEKTDINFNTVEKNGNSGYYI